MLMLIRAYDFNSAIHLPQVDRMRKFVMINTLAVIKITKKHDKHSPRQLQVPSQNETITQ
jgi:SPX domain protein involved in polyphosphate accumulation